MLVFVLVLVPAAARGGGFDFDHVQLATTGGDFLATERAGVPAWEWRAGAAYRYEDQPLMLARGTSREALVGARSLLEVAASVELGRWVGIGASLPFVLDARGSAVAPGAALGDLRIVPRVEIVRRPRVALALLGGLRAPTGDPARFAGEGGVGFEPRLPLTVTAGLFCGGVNARGRV